MAGSVKEEAGSQMNAKGGLRWGVQDFFLRQAVYVKKWELLTRRI